MSLGLLYTGGTIGSAGVPLTVLHGEDFAERFEALVRPQLPECFRDVPLEHIGATVDSTNMGPPDWLDFARRIAASPHDALVVLHGTDTMAWTGAALAFLLRRYDPAGHVTGRLNKRVVLTGSQYPMFGDGGLASDSDGFSNICNALEDAAGTPSEVLSFGGLTLEAQRSLKTSSTSLTTFQMPNGPGAPFDAPLLGGAEIAAEIDRLSPYFGHRQVVSITAAPGTDLAAQITGVLDNMAPDLGALHLLGFGIGNLPGEAMLRPVLTRAAEAGVLLAIGTQCPAGPVVSATYGVGHWLAELGVMETGDMPWAATQVKLHMCLALGEMNAWQSADKKAFFARNIVGELA
ncbi:MAG: asparaginase domain-containing protein [Pseudomonadota bacterium]